MSIIVIVKSECDMRQWKSLKYKNTAKERFTIKGSCFVKYQ